VPTVATWNVNSVRMRLERLKAWLARRSPDVVCLQETKVQDEGFPRAEFESLGWHVATFGQKTWNGVAILSREPLEDVVRGLPGDAPDADRRLLAGRVGGIKVASVYVPNGQALDSPKWPYKLDWLRRLRGFVEGWAKPDEEVVVCGDFNVAPEDRDVHDPDLWRGQVLFHPKEHAALANLSSFGLHDLFRKHHAEPGHFSWWDYRQLAFPKGHGLRIDLVLGSAASRDRCSGCDIDREERKGEKPSDHAPVVATFGA
jgi:exodeoxyribonuclease-3